MRPLPAEEWDTPKPQDKSDSTSNVVHFNGGETTTKPALNEIKPATRVEIGKHYGVTSAAIGKWLKQIREIWEPRKEAGDLTTPDNLVSSWGQIQLQQFQELGASAYEFQVLENNPIHSLARFSGHFEEPEEIEAIQIEDCDFQREEAIALALQHLEGKAQAGLERSAQFNHQSKIRLARNRRLKQNLLIRQGQADAMEDAALYTQSYDSALAQALAAQLKAEEAAGDDE
ncbi:hypothetical protein [Sodalinema gerasimenkoae]|uniref:hypothetical protein n=1 Tax=Sodalinema gerasimenkoae TaxID=2862348 RepID=UPI001359BE62|nr:hypothetical protein [Sodalinema gerasimenkoae]